MQPSAPQWLIGNHTLTRVKPQRGSASSPSLQIRAVSALTLVSRKPQKAQEALLEAVSGVGGRGKGASDAQKQVIAEAVDALEADGGIQNPTGSELIEGRWRLLYTTRPGTASPIQRTFVGVDAFTVFQEIELRGTEDPRVTNCVRFSKSFGELRVEAAAAVVSGRRIDFRFDRAAFYLKFWPYKVPYPVPFRLLGDEAKGWLDTTYMSPSGELRISRGNKGTTFVLQRDPAPRELLLRAIKAKGDVEQAIEDLAAQNPTQAPAKADALFGRWRLVWTSQSSNASALQKFSVNFTRNWQVLEKQPPRLENVVEFLPGVRLRAEADCVTSSNVRTNVAINSGQLELGPLKIPLGIKGEGYVEQLYLDNKLRISRGDKGSLFVHVRDS